MEYKRQYTDDNLYGRLWSNQFYAGGREMLNLGGTVRKSSWKRIKKEQENK